MTDEPIERPTNLVVHSAEIVGAYVEHNTVGPSDLPGLIATVHRALSALRGQPAEPIAPPQEPAVPVRKSIRPDGIVCLEDGKTFKSLKRHLASHHDLSPEQYRAKWKLPVDYPMVAPNYSAKRSELAKTIGLGKKPKAGSKASRRGAPKR